MVEAFTKWDKCASHPLTIIQRGTACLFDDDGTELYSYKTSGMLACSDTMSRPIVFLVPCIGEDIARNAVGLPNTGRGILIKGCGILKPAGKAI